MASCDKSLNFSPNPSPAAEDLDNGDYKDSREANDTDLVCSEAKRLRALEPSIPKGTSNKGRKTLFGKTNSSHPEETNPMDNSISLFNPSKGSASESAWHCSLCTYCNNSLLSYCEICESPRVQKSK